MKQYKNYFLIFMLAMIISCSSTSATKSTDENVNGTSSTPADNQNMLIGRDVRNIILEDGGITNTRAITTNTNANEAKIPDAVQRSAYVNGITFLAYNFNGITLSINNIFTNQFNERLQLEYVNLAFLGSQNTEVFDYAKEIRYNVPQGQRSAYSYEIKIPYSAFRDNSDDIFLDTNIDTNINSYSLLGEYTFNVGNKRRFKETVYFPFRLQLLQIPEPKLSLREVVYNYQRNEIRLVMDITMYNPTGFTHVLVESDNTLIIDGNTVDSKIADVGDIFITDYGILSYTITYNLNQNNIGPQLFQLLDEGFKASYVFRTDLLFKDQKDFDKTISLATNGIIDPAVF